MSDAVVLDRRAIEPKANVPAEHPRLAGVRRGKKKVKPVDDGPTVMLVEDPKKQKPVTFFSRFRDDVLVMQGSDTKQVGPSKWITVPAKTVTFRDRALVTNDATIIAFLRNHARYGIELLEFGVPGHDDRIKLYDDGGQIAKLERLGRLGRIAQRQWRLARGLGLEDAL